MLTSTSGRSYVDGSFYLEEVLVNGGESIE